MAATTTEKKVEKKQTNSVDTSSKKEEKKVGEAEKAIEPVKKESNLFQLSTMQISDIMHYREACTILRDYYANSVRITDDIESRREFQKKFDKYNSILNMIMEEIEKRMEKLCR